MYEQYFPRFPHNKLPDRYACHLYPSAFKKVLSPDSPTCPNLHSRKKKCIKWKTQTSHQSTVYLSWLITVVKRPGKFHTKPNFTMADGFAGHGNLQTALRSAVFCVQHAWSWGYSLMKSAKRAGISCHCNMLIAADSLVSVQALQDPRDILPAVCSPHRWSRTPRWSSQIVTSLISFMSSYLCKWSHGVRPGRVNDHLSTSVRDSQSGRMLIEA